MKSNRTHKIQAFTLTELLIAIAISTVVIALGYTAFSLLNRNIVKIQSNYSEGTQTRLLQEQLLIDLHTYPTSQYRQLEDKLVFSSPIDSVVYQFESTDITRADDTINQNLVSKTLYLKGEKIKSGAVDALKFVIGDSLKKTNLFVYKSNDGVTLLGSEN